GACWPPKVKPLEDDFVCIMLDARGPEKEIDPWMKSEIELSEDFPTRFFREHLSTLMWSLS
ncbi:MAG: hypothetical protein P8046_02415, partial [Anaerolineales bacterium]